MLRIKNGYVSIERGDKSLFLYISWGLLHHSMAACYALKKKTVTKEIALWCLFPKGVKKNIEKLSI